MSRVSVILLFLWMQLFIWAEASAYPYSWVTLDAKALAEGQLDPNRALRVGLDSGGRPLEAAQVLAQVLDGTGSQPLDWHENQERWPQRPARSWNFLEIRNPSDSPIDIILFKPIAYPITHDFHIFDSDRKLIKHVEAGSLSDFMKRDRQLNKAAASIHFEPKQTIYILMDQYAPWFFDTRYTIDSIPRFAVTERNFTIVYAMAAVLVLVLLLNNLALYYCVKDRVYLANLVYILGVCLLLAWLSGIYGSVASRLPSFLGNLQFSFPFLMSWALCNLVCHLLRLHSTRSHLLKFLTQISRFSLAVSVLAFFLPRWAFPVAAVLFSTIIVTSLWATLLGSLQGERLALAFLLTCLPPIIVTGWFFSGAPFLEESLTVDTISIVLMIQLLSMSLGLSHRVLEMRRNYLSTLEETNSNLEVRVNERTKELVESNQRLEAEIKNRILAQDALRKQEATTLHHAKMRALGEMSGGVAHEVNNPLMIISGYSEMIIKITKKPEASLERIREISTRIIETTRRIAFVIQALRNYSHQRPEEFENHSASNLVNQAMALCQSKVQNCGVKLLLELEEFMIRVDGGKFLQVLIALVKNATDALAAVDHKELTIRSYSVKQSKPPLVRIEFSDSGPGVPGGLEEKIFEAFFTTKEVGEGAGLGLSLAKEIIERAKGRLYLHPTQRSTFVIELPAIAPES